MHTSDIILISENGMTHLRHPVSFVLSGMSVKTVWVSKVFWGQSKNEIKFGGTLFQLVKLGANFGGLK